MGRWWSGPLPKLSNCQWVTISGPAQLLVSRAIGPSHKQATADESTNGRQSGGRPVQSEVRGRSLPPPWSLQLTQPWITGGPREHAEACVLQGHRTLAKATHWQSQAWGGNDSLPHPRLCDLIAVAACIGCSLWDLAPTIWTAWGAWGRGGSWAPGSLRDDNWAGSEDLALREMPTEMHLFSQAWTLPREPRLGAGWMLCVRVTEPCRDRRLIARAWILEGEISA